MAIEQVFLQALMDSGGVTNLVVAMAIVYLGREIHGLKKSVEGALPKIDDLRERVGVLEAIHEEGRAIHGKGLG